MRSLSSARLSTVGVDTSAFLNRHGCNPLVRRVRLETLRVLQEHGPLRMACYRKMELGLEL